MQAHESNFTFLSTITDFYEIPFFQRGYVWEESNWEVLFNDLGARFKQNSDHAVLTHVFNGGSAENAGLCPQDKIIALGGYACNDLAAQWSKLPIGTRTTIHFFRQGLLRETSITVQAAEANTALLHITDRPKLENWLYNH